MDGYTRGEIPDYQMAAMAMAIFFQGMTLEETACLTDVMMRSGDLVDTSSIALPKVDKHSTGGVGDKVSLILAPLVACCGVAVPMISGRGLGITGGTLDKLESIPGYRTDLSEKEFLAVLQACGCCIIGQTGQLAPADKKLYALRDVTGTVPSIPLITGSIMSKKLAEGIDALVLDVKWGEGAFMKTLEQARELAETLVAVGRKMDKKMGALITDMNQPLGRCAGNALEVIESVECLAGRGPDDLMDVTMALCAQMLQLTGICKDQAEALSLLQEKIQNGEALQRFKEMVRLQGGDPAALEDYTRLPTARIEHPYPAPCNGNIRAVNANAIGRACAVLGAGRRKTTDSVDFAVGISGLRKVGESVQAGEPLLLLHANSDASLESAIEELAAAFDLVDEPVSTPPLINHSIL
jgi:pyrimidine-nucleoside phosphorylase